MGHGSVIDRGEKMKKEDKAVLEALEAWMWAVLVWIALMVIGAVVSDRNARMAGEQKEGADGNVRIEQQAAESCRAGADSSN